ncbi:MAG: hypothetical protein AB7G37_03400 [Solirubrobacteraceae bacterium]
MGDPLHPVPPRRTTAMLTARAHAYYRLPGNSVGGSLHIVLDDTNVDDDCTQFCVFWAREQGDVFGEGLALDLLGRTPHARHRVARQMERPPANAERWPRVSGS